MMSKSFCHTLLFIFLFILFFSGSLHAQTYKAYQTDNIHNKLMLNTKTGEVKQVQDDGQIFIVHPSTTPDNEKPNRYELYKTKNMWTFILLDTFTGKLWQCQFSINGDEYRSSWVINPYNLSSYENSKFTIEPLISMFQYYLIDEETGNMWKFQWSVKGDEYRWIEK
jgi:hypothetical protein